MIGFNCCDVQCSEGDVHREGDDDDVCVLIRLFIYYYDAVNPHPSKQEADQCFWKCVCFYSHDLHYRICLCGLCHAEMDEYRSSHPPQLWCLT